MIQDEKAEIILNALDEYMTINWNLQEFYLKAIKRGLNKIEEKSEVKELVE